MGVHDGHRERLRQQFLEHGLESMNDLNALELLLFYAIPRRDTNELAHALLDQFGTIDRVFDATEQELCAVPGIGPQAASLILLVPQMYKKSKVSAASRTQILDTPKAAAEYLIPRFYNEGNEMALLVCLDSKKRVICTEILGKGAVGCVEVNVRRAMELVLRHKATYAILSHNHPDGQLKSSPADDHLTKRLDAAFRNINVTLVDHIIVAGDKYFSYERAGVMNTYHLF